MRCGLLLLALLIAACEGPPPRPAVAEPAAFPSAPSVSVGGNVRALYGYTR